MLVKVDLTREVVVERFLCKSVDLPQEHEHEDEEGEEEAEEDSGDLHILLSHDCDWVLWFDLVRW